MLLTFILLVPLFFQTFATPVETPTRRLDLCIIPSVRKEWRSFSTREKTEYFKAFKCLANKPHDKRLSPNPPTPGVPVNASASLFDDLVYVHSNQLEKIHMSAIFLPFHRWFLNTVEQRLRKDCGYRGPMGYWDWTKDASSGIQKSSIFDGNRDSGLGSFGKASNGFVVTDGAWGGQQVAYPTPHTIVRNFTATPFREGRMQPEFINKPNQNVNDAVKVSVVNDVVKGNKGDFVKFYNQFDELEGFHSGVHFAMGGDMGDTSYSPNDPLFFLHHGMLDRVWAMWQNQHPSNKKAFGGGSTWALQSAEAWKTFGPAGMPPNIGPSARIPNVGMGDSVTVADILDIRGGYLCYSYL
ncbi:Di-copper centre-containing protein [Pterulicium gracile]|uniref:Di-copper centre-containing protein n=1 Tax=Pterulicium gracile TaxID=1884261 RepID=A0A5C3Q243_9AGAR|nr:Di-copper centre-containing protein [Pterula gracilis]